MVSDQTTCTALKERNYRLERVESQLNETRKLLQDELKLRRILIEESRDAIVILNDQGGVYEVNPSFARLLGYTMDEMYELYVWDWDVHLDKEQIMARLKEVNPAGHRFETVYCCKDGTLIDVELSNNGAVYRGEKFTFCICRDITERKKAEKERDEMIETLQASLSEIKTLRGILPLCSFCKKVRNDAGNWEEVDIYIEKHSEADITHSVCPECFKKHYPEEYEYIQLYKQK